MNPLFLSAGRAAENIRISLDLKSFEPINIYDVCMEQGLTIRFVDINMEGMYLSSTEGGAAEIWISNKRPLVRRAYTCAHELGHHYFKHGTKVDSLAEQSQYNSEQDEEEDLVNVFAGFLLMPIAGIRMEMAKRAWTSRNLSVMNCYIMSSIFGVGYSTFITHLRSHRMISYKRAESLLNYSPARIWSEFITSTEANTHFKVFDKLWEPKTVDIEETNYILLPSCFSTASSLVRQVFLSKNLVGYQALCQGEVVLTSSENQKTFSLRIQRTGYHGLAEFRHLQINSNV